MTSKNMLAKETRKRMLLNRYSKVTFLIFNLIPNNVNNPENVRYKYKLDPVDKDWSPSRQLSEQTYSGIRPGDYSFLVMSENENGIWNEDNSGMICSLEQQPVVDDLQKIHNIIIRPKVKISGTVFYLQLNLFISDPIYALFLNVHERLRRSLYIEHFH